MAIRPTLGILNIMPKARSYERLLLPALGEDRTHVDVRMMRLSTHAYESSADARDTYLDVRAALREKMPELLIITGAPVEDREFEKIHYWNELLDVISSADEAKAHILGVCFGGLALARYLGASKRVLDDKLFGSFVLTSLDTPHGKGPAVWQEEMYFSTWAVLESTPRFRTRAAVTAAHPETGPAIAVTYDRRITMVMGHPEYGVHTLRDEWLRDKERGIAYTRKYSEAIFSSMAREPRSPKPNLIHAWLAEVLVTRSKQNAVEDVKC